MKCECVSEQCEPQAFINLFFKSAFSQDACRQARELEGGAQPEVAAAGENHLRRPGGEGAAVGDGL